jgi:predicted transcriptional regulator
MTDEPLISVSVRVPRSVTERVKQLAKAQDRTVQGIYTRALRSGLDLEEDRHRIACEAIKASERRTQHPADRRHEEA